MINPCDARTNWLATSALVNAPASRHVLRGWPLGPEGRVKNLHYPLQIAKIAIDQSAEHYCSCSEDSVPRSIASFPYHHLLQSMFCHSLWFVQYAGVSRRHWQLSLLSSWRYQHLVPCRRALCRSSCLWFSCGHSNPADASVRRAVATWDIHQ